MALTRSTNFCANANIILEKLNIHVYIYIILFRNKAMLQKYLSHLSSVRSTRLNKRLEGCMSLFFGPIVILSLRDRSFFEERGALRNTGSL